VFKGEPVASLSRGTDGKLVVRSSNRTVTAGRLLVGVPPAAFGRVRGSVARGIQAQPQFKSVYSVPAFKAAAVYEEAWWEGLLEDMHYRSGFEHRFLALPCAVASGVGEKGERVLHTAFEIGEKAEWLRDTCDKGHDMFQVAMQRELQDLFPEVHVPLALEVQCQFWESGWHAQKAHHPYERHDVFKWAKDPLPGANDVFMIGEAYGEGSAWVEPALQSAARVLEKVWGVPPRVRDRENFVWWGATEEETLQYLRGLPTPEERAGASDRRGEGGFDFDDDIGHLFT